MAVGCAKIVYLLENVLHVYVFFGKVYICCQNNKWKSILYTAISWFSIFQHIAHINLKFVEIADQLALERV